MKEFFKKTWEILKPILLTLITLGANFLVKIIGEMIEDYKLSKNKKNKETRN